MAAPAGSRRGAGKGSHPLSYLSPAGPRIILRYMQKEHGLGKEVVVSGGKSSGSAGPARQIKEKTSGQQKSYFADQDQFDTVSDDDLHSLDAKIVALTTKVQSLQQSCHHTEAELKELTHALTIPEMQKEIQELKKELKKAACYIKAATSPVTPEDRGVQRKEGVS
ncbi:homologous-pairing protein 2-like [Sigmodon hispidus]